MFFFEEFGCLGDEFLGTFLVGEVGLREPPVGHGAIGIVSEDLTEGTFGFVVPKSVKLAKALVEVGLALIPGACDREVDFSGVSDERGCLAWSLVEGVALMGMSFFDLSGLFTKKKGAKQGQNQKSFHGRCLQSRTTRWV